MKTKKSTFLLASLASIVVVIIMLLTSCTQQGATTTTKPSTQTASVVERDKTYNVVNPAGEFIPVQTKGLAPRLDTFDGKTMWVSQTEADPVLMPALYARLQKDYPKTTWKTNSTGSTSPVRLTTEEQAGCKAMIMGDAW